MERYQDFTRILATGAPAPSATVTVYNAGTLVLATIYSDNSLTPQANPYTSDSTGYFKFYAADGRYDVKISGTGITTYTLGDVLLNNVSGLSVTTKGDLQTYSNAAARLPVGTDGQVLKSASGQATGLQWAAETGSGWTDSGVTVSPTTNTDTIALASTNPITAPGAGANSERFGSGATAAGTSTVAIGNGASASATNGVSIGTSALNTGSGVAIGKSASAAGAGVAIGASTTSADGEFRCRYVTDIYFGSGGTQSAGPTITHYGVNGGGAGGGNKAGGAIGLVAGLNTGQGANGEVFLKAPIKDGAGDALNPVAIDRYRIKSKVALTHTVATTVLSFTPAAEDFIGGKLLVTIVADQAGVGVQVFTAEYVFSATLFGGTIYSSITLLNSANSVSAGTIVVTAVTSLSNGGATVNIQFTVTCTTVVPDTIYAYIQHFLNSVTAPTYS